MSSNSKQYILYTFSQITLIFGLFSKHLYDERNFKNKDRSACNRILATGRFVHIFRPKIQGLFKDFPGPYFEISRTFF